MTEVTTLRAACLWSKWGFEDGDVMFNPMYRLGYVSQDMSSIGDEDVLAECVRRYLLPLLPAGTPVEIVNTHHNPVRHPDYGRDAVVPEWAKGVSVDLTDDQIEAVCADLKIERSAERKAPHPGAENDIH